jgi:uncharacterized membrane protein YedE/YeeE
MRAAVNFIAGLIFGLGLLISGMANPAKVQNFLDLAGTFDPSLISITSLPLLAKGTLIFVPAMIVGIGLARLLTQANIPGHSISAASKQD